MKIISDSVIENCIKSETWSERYENVRLAWWQISKKKTHFHWVTSNRNIIYIFPCFINATVKWNVRAENCCSLCCSNEAVGLNHYISRMTRLKRTRQLSSSHETHVNGSSRRTCVKMLSSFPNYLLLLLLLAFLYTEGKPSDCLERDKSGFLEPHTLNYN